MSESMIERVERALAIHFSGNRQPCMSGDPRDRLSPLQRRNLSDAARAAIEAMREASDEMVEAMNNQAYYASLSYPRGHIGPGAWSAAIDAALSEHGQGG